MSSGNKAIPRNPMNFKRKQQIKELRPKYIAIKNTTSQYKNLIEIELNKEKRKLTKIKEQKLIKTK